MNNPLVDELEDNVWVLDPEDVRPVPVPGFKRSREREQWR
jgi:hypothetical protein